MIPHSHCGDSWAFSFHFPKTTQRRAKHSPCLLHKCFRGSQSSLPVCLDQLLPPCVRTQEVLRAGPGAKWEALSSMLSKCWQEGRGWKEERRDGGREGKRERLPGRASESCDLHGKGSWEFCTWLQSCQVAVGTGLRPLSHPSFSHGRV